MQLAYGRDDAFDLIVAEAEGVGDGVFRNFEAAGFDHHNGFFTSGDDDIQQALFLLGRRGIGDELPLEQTHAHGGNRLGKGQVGNKRRGGSAGNGDHVGIVFAIGGQDQSRRFAFHCANPRERGGGAGDRSAAK